MKHGLNPLLGGATADILANVQRGKAVEAGHHVRLHPAPITPDTVLRPGMLFRTPGSPRRAPCSGRITKVNRVNVLFDSPYMTGEILHPSLPRHEFNGGVYVTENPTPCTP